MSDSASQQSEALLAEATVMVRTSPLPMMLVRLPGKEIIAASEAAVRALAAGRGPRHVHGTSRPPGTSIEGQSVESFLADPPSPAAGLLLAGNLSRYDVLRALRPDGEHAEVVFRVQRLDGVPDVVIAIVEVGAASAAPDVQLPAGPPVVGSTNADLVIDQISSSVEALLDETVEQVVGRSLLRMIQVADVAALLRAVAQRNATGQCVTTVARLRGREVISPPGQLIVLPRSPIPSCVFTFIPAAMPVPVREGLTNAEEPRHLPGGRSQALLPAHPEPGGCVVRVLLQRLTDREADIVSRLVRGDRVPGIARDLFLAPATVRNHLSAAYRKLGVSSQQDVIDLFRGRDPRR